MYTMYIVGVYNNTHTPVTLLELTLRLYVAPYRTILLQHKLLPIGLALYYDLARINVQWMSVGKVVHVTIRSPLSVYVNT